MYIYYALIVHRRDIEDDEENYYNKFLLASNEIEMLRNEIEKLVQQNAENL